MKSIEFALPPGLRDLFTRLAFDSRTRERCWKKMARQLRFTHISMERSFRILQERAKKEHNPAHLAYGRIAGALLAGHPIGKALSRYATPEEIMLIDSGQTGGEATLPEGFAKAADLLEKRRKIKEMLIKELAYPVFLLGAVVAFLFMVSTMLVPQMSRLSNPETWTGPAWMLYAVSNFVNSWYGAATLLLLIASFCLVGFSFQHWSGMGRSFADRFPPWSIHRILVGVSWLYATAILLQTGVKIAVVLKKSIENPDMSPYLRSRLRPIYRHITQGLSLGDALWATPSKWPDRVLADDLRTYAALPGFTEQLAQIAEDMMTECMERIQRAAGILGTAAILLLVLTVIFLVFGVFSIQQHVTQGIGI